MNRLDSISDSTGTLVACTYLGAGQIVKETDAGATLSYLNTDGTNVTGLDRFGRVLDQLWSDYSQTPSVPVDHYTYTYDRAGNRHTDHNLLHEDFNETFTYDDLDRLATSVRADGHDQSWGLDGLGNFGTFTNDSDVQTRDASPANEIGNVTGGTVTPTYDTAGNMISGPSSGDETVRVHYTYDAWNRLVEVRADSAQNPGQPGDLIATYKYDGANHRVEKTVYDLSIGDPTATTDYYYNQQWQVVEERMLPAGENQSTVVTQYVWDQSYIDTPVVRFRGSETLYYTTDANHNVTSLVDPAGEVVERYVYDAYGKVTFCGGLWTPLTTGGNNSTTRSGVSSAYVNEVLYCGYRYDPETSLVISTTVATAGNYQDRNRELITTLSTFDVRDPILYQGGINLYEYCGDDPVVYSDALGFCKCQVKSFKVNVRGKPTYKYVPISEKGGQFDYYDVFSVDIEFSNDGDASCSCCEYRQQVKVSGEHFGPFKKDWREDTEQRGKTLLRYGHRGDCGLQNVLDWYRYDTDQLIDLYYLQFLDPFAWLYYSCPAGERAEGCRYHAEDSPGWKIQYGAFGELGATVSANYQFKGQVLDTCNGGKVVAEKQWSVVLPPRKLG